MNDGTSNIVNIIKKVVKRYGIVIVKTVLPIVLIIALLASFIYFLDIDATAYKDGDWTNTPYAASQYTSNVTMSDSGKLTSSMTAQELWDKMKEEGNDIAKFLKGPEELLKLMNAETITKFVDTRSDPSQPIDWDTLNKNVDSKELQGIIKLKRKLSDGSDPFYMTYVDPDTFQSYIDAYNSSSTAAEAEEAKKKVLSHFTLGSTVATSSSAGILTGNGNFTKYPDLTEDQLRGLAALCKQEQGTLKGVAAEASLMANLFELQGSSFGTGSSGLYNYVRTSGWFYDSKNTMDSGNVEDEYIQVVKAVLVNGKRTIPGYIDEHDCFSDIASATNNGSNISITDRFQYKEHITKMKNVYDAEYTFYCFPDATSDPFGYKSEANRTKIGDAYYDFDTGELVNGTGGETPSEPETSESGSVGEWRWPTDGTQISSFFGPRTAPLPGASTDHGAIDIAVSEGTNVYACDAGKVITSGYYGNAGNMITIDHGNGYISTYMHNSVLKVSVGDTVTKGQIIALSGNTGNSTGPHLHFQVEYNGTKVDPLTFKYDNGMGDGSVTPGNGSGSSSTSQYYAIVASWNETTDKVTSDDPEQDTYTKTTYNMTTTKINYQELVKGYTMPFDYLWAMLVIGDDKDFVMDLADLVYDSEIEITVHDNLTTNKNVNVYTYTRKKKTITTAKVTATGILDMNVQIREKTGGPWEDYKETNYKTTYTTITKTNTLVASVTLADVWMAKFTQDYTHQTPEDIVSTSGGPLDDILYPNTPSATGTSDTYGHARDLLIKAKGELIGCTYITGVINYVNEKIYYTTINRKEDITNTLSSKTFVAGDVIAKEKTDKESTEPNFVTIFLDYNNSKARNNILSVESWLFEAIESNKNTEHLLDLTKYLLYKATGTDYGVTEYDFSTFNSESFNSINTSSTDLLKQYIRKWEHSTPPPTNGDGTKYIIETDGAGHPTVGYGIDIENSGYKARFVAAGYPTTVGGAVDIDFVDAIEEEIISNNLSTIKSMTSALNLTEYQINALVSRSYNCGISGALSVLRGSPSMDFVYSYRNYWNQNTDDLFEEKNKNANFSHKLYTQYMSKPVTSEGVYMSGLEKRRKSEWTLFQTGYYDTLDKWHSSGSGNILQVADEIHQAEITWTYSVGGDLYWNDIERSLNNPNKVTCCATYVSCVLYKAGYFTEDQMNSFNYNYVPSLYTFLTNAGWQKITSYNDLQPGDVVITSGQGHVQLYAGNDTWYNAGSTSAIQRASPYSQGSWARSEFTCAFRPR